MRATKTAHRNSYTASGSQILICWEPTMDQSPSLEGPRWRNRCRPDQLAPIVALTMRMIKGIGILKRQNARVTTTPNRLITIKKKKRDLTLADFVEKIGNFVNQNLRQAPMTTADKITNRSMQGTCNRSRQIQHFHQRLVQPSIIPKVNSFAISKIQAVLSLIAVK